jgi:dihydrodipicolinate synthase/N-acetylneuraminate lyase
MIMAPYFYRYSQRELETFFVEFARETGDAVPILIQNLPEATSTLEFDLMRRLIETGRFAGINDSSGDWNLFESLIQLKRQMPFALLAGSDRLAARALREGADGIVSAAACAVPDLMTRLPQASNVLTDFLDRSEKFPFPVAIKRAVEIRGQKSAPPLTPLAPENEAALNEFSAWFKGWLPQMRKAAAVV